MSNNALRVNDPLMEALKRYFGFASFKPLQAEIVADVLAGHDVFALLPTGGGKSLCYQLPALLTPGLTVVVSPLVALMKDQVDALQTAGIGATFLNSSLSPSDARWRIDGLERGEYKLLYVAPERLMLPDFLIELGRWNVCRFAIDEAHCISEWGHDFRPEYRRLAEVRERFRAAPFLAFTATATQRVRDDIVAGLRLRAPKCYIASFNRPNLTYRVLPKDRALESLVAWLRARPRESGIVYAQSRTSTERLAERLGAAGISALPYHAGLDSQTRARHQNRFIRDEVSVICATIAFGMGIDKSNVRFVVHYDVPKSIEGYYQETGRAGRDGLPAECVLYFSYADIAKLEHFVTAAGPGEQARTHAQLEQIKRYAYTSACRRRELLAYFHERFDGPNCGACDNCLAPRPEREVTVSAQKLLACVYRIREASGYRVGITHVIDVLLGTQTDKVWRFGHDRLSTFGIGSDLDRRGWRHLADELLRLGYLIQDSERFNVVSLTDIGKRALIERTPILARAPVAAPAAARERKRSRGQPVGASNEAAGYDEALFTELRRVRKELADTRDVPAYVIFSDAVLRDFARVVPRTLSQLRAISGVGDKKLADFGDYFLAAIATARPAS